MSNYLKGNFKTKVKIEAPAEPRESASDTFEGEALRRLGGSIAYVSRKAFLWQGNDPKPATEGDEGKDS